MRYERAAGAAGTRARCHEGGKRGRMMPAALLAAREAIRAHGEAGRRLLPSLVILAATFLVIIGG